MAARWDFAGFWDKIAEPTPYDNTPIWQSCSVGCPSCGDTLYYSSGWDRRTCDNCGYIEGFRNQQCYPDALTLQEFLFVVGEWYIAVCNRELDSMEYRTLLRGITFKGSSYRPPGEYPYEFQDYR